jgi:hypothetical protein
MGLTKTEIFSEEQNRLARGIQREQTTPIYPLRSFALTWHADVGHIMHMVPCIAYFIHKICHLPSLDMQCVNAICLVSISYM